MEFFLQSSNCVCVRSCACVHILKCKMAYCYEPMVISRETLTIDCCFIRSPFADGPAAVADLSAAHQ